MDQEELKAGLVVITVKRLAKFVYTNQEAVAAVVLQVVPRVVLVVHLQALPQDLLNQLVFLWVAHYYNFMKKYIWTLWTDPWGDFYIDNLMCYALSISLVQRFTKNLLVYTDDRGADLLNKHKIYVPHQIVNFDIQYTEYPKFSEAKLKTMLMQSDPFCHIDHDVFLFKQQPHESYCDLVVQNLETGEPWYSNYFAATNAESLNNIDLPQEFIDCASNGDFCGYNCGYVDANNLEVIQDWCNTGINVSKQYSPKSKVESTLPVQFCLYALSRYRNYNIKTLFLDPFTNQKEVVERGYVHLMGAKGNRYRYILSRLLVRIKEFAPLFYSTISGTELEDNISKQVRKHHIETKNAGFSRSFFLVNTQKNVDIRSVYLDKKKIGRLFRTTAGFKTFESLRTFFADFDFSYDETDPNISNDIKEHLITVESMNIFKKVSQVAQKHSLNFRVYKTFHGLRLICKNKLLNPESAYVKQLYRDLRADPAMDRFAVENFAFPARVQPKPKRIIQNHSKNFSLYRMDEDNQKEWLTEYNQEMRKYRVCEYISDINGVPEEDITLPECQKVISIHDKLTRTFSDLPLA
jgi:peroxiredoxin family protein